MAARRPVVIINYSPNFNRLARSLKSKPMGQILFSLLLSSAEKFRD